MRSGRGRSTLEAPLDLKRSCDFAARWNLDLGSGRTRRHTEHRIRRGDPCWNVHVYRGESCRQARALGRSHCERCIPICKDLFSIFRFSPAKTPSSLLSAKAKLPSVSSPETHRFSRRRSLYQNRFPLKYPSRSYRALLSALATFADATGRGGVRLCRDCGRNRLRDKIAPDLARRRPDPPPTKKRGPRSSSLARLLPVCYICLLFSSLCPFSISRQSLHICSRSRSTRPTPAI